MTWKVSKGRKTPTQQQHIILISVIAMVTKFEQNYAFVVNDETETINQN